MSRSRGRHHPTPRRSCRLPGSLARRRAGLSFLMQLRCSVRHQLAAPRGKSSAIAIRGGTAGGARGSDRALRLPVTRLRPRTFCAPLATAAFLGSAFDAGAGTPARSATAAHHALGNATRQGAPQRRQRHDSTTRPSCTWLASSVIAPTASHARHLVGGGGSRSVDRRLNHRHRRSGFANFA